MKQFQGPSPSNADGSGTYGLLMGFSSKWIIFFVSFNTEKAKRVQQFAHPPHPGIPIFNPPSTIFNLASSAEALIIAAS